MKKSILNTGLIVSVLLLAQTNVFAYEKFEKKMQNRQHKQSQRIENGFNKGELTYHELRRLIKKQFRFERLSSDFLDDGHYSKRERKILRRKYDKLDTMIYRMKHNRDKFRYF